MLAEEVDEQYPYVMNIYIHDKKGYPSVGKSLPLSPHAAKLEVGWLIGANRKF